MKIRTQFLLTMFLFGLLLIIMATSMVLTQQQVERLNQQVEIANQVERAARDLSYLWNDYLLYGEAQQRARWESKFEAFSEQVSRLNPANPDQQALINNMRATQARMQSNFESAVSTIEGVVHPSDSEAYLVFIRASWGRMEVLNQSLVFDASLFANRLNDQLNQLKQTNAFIIFILVAIFAAYFVANYGLIYRHTLKSIAELQEGTKIIGSGNLGFVLPARRNDEIGALARAFNSMTTNLKEVTASKEDLEREIAERKRMEQERERLLAQVQAQAKDLQSANEALQCQSEELAVQAEELRTQNDSLLHIQQQLRESTTQLMRSNQELQEFAFVASHDLQEPLRKILSFSRMIGTRSTLDETETMHLSRVQDAAQRMQKMINALLELSRITTNKKVCERVDVNQVAKNVVDDLEGRIRQTHGLVILNPLPTLEADPIQMHQLLQNLVGNALKFHHPDSSPVVQVGYREHSPGKVELYVQDNGIGFDMEYLNQIFLPFKRLHGRSEYEGSGIGLALCQKIAERHGGQITAQSVPGQGSTFSVVLPLKQPVR